MDKGMRKASEGEGGATNRRTVEARGADAERTGMTAGSPVQGRDVKLGDHAANAAGHESGKAQQPNSKQHKPNQPKKAKKRRHPALAGLLWTLRIIVVPLLCIIALFAGLYLGYTKLGNAPAEDVWKLETWLHMFDLIFSDT